MTTIDPTREYSPREITNEGWIKNTVGNANYGFTLKLIGRKLLKARNINPTGQVPVFRVKGSAILDYLNS